MKRQGWIKYSNIEREGLFGIDIHDKDLMARIQASEIPYRIEHDFELFNETINSLYIRKEDYPTIRKLSPEPNCA